MFFERLLKRKGILILMLSLAILCGIAPGNTLAMPIDSQMALQAPAAGIQLEKIQSFLNKGIVQKRLAKLGLSKESAMRYVSKLDETQLAKLAEQVDNIEAGADTGFILLIIVLIALCVLYFADYKVKLEPRHKSR